MTASIKSYKKMLDYRILITSSAEIWTISREKVKKCEGSLLRQPKEYQLFRLKMQSTEKVSTAIKTQVGNLNNTEKDANIINCKYPPWESSFKKKRKEKQAKISASISTIISKR